MQLIEFFSRLNPYLTVEGVDFELQLIINGRPDDVRLVYQIVSVDTKSPHYNQVTNYSCWESPFHNKRQQGFLYLVQNIATDEDFTQACDECYEFLKKK